MTLTEPVKPSRRRKPGRAATTLRPATREDWARLLAWRNDPVTRAQSRVTAPVKRAAHRAWLARVLANPETRLYIATDREGNAVGTGRLDYRGQGLAEVNLTVAPEWRGRGFAGEIINALAVEARALGWTRLTARVKLSNGPSLRAFLAAGFASDECIHFERES
jgi:RimJ/RimL family protein N-acetyltransferase